MESHTGAAGALDSKQKKQETGEDAGRDWVVASVVPGDSEGQPEGDKHKARGRSGGGGTWIFNHFASK